MTIILLLLVIVAAAGVGYYYLYSRKTKDSISKNDNSTINDAPIVDNTTATEKTPEWSK